MTFHVAMASKVGAVMLSDSQGSTQLAEAHGFQKQGAGNNFLVGVSGHGAVCLGLLAELSTGALTNKGTPPKNAADVERITTGYMGNEVFPGAALQVGALFIVPGSAGYTVKRYEPAVFKKFTDSDVVGTIGSGADFANRARAHNEGLGVQQPETELVDLFYSAESLACAANESLTVDDQLLIGILRHGKSYQLGHAELKISQAPDQLRQNWLTAAGYYHEVRAMAATMRSELRQAQVDFSEIRNGAGTLSGATIQRLQSSAQAIQVIRSQLAAKLVDYCKWYDALLGRP